MDTIKKRIEEKWLVESLGVWNFSHKKYFNWCGIVTRDEEGNNKYEWLKGSNNDDEYYNFAKVKEGDIIYAGSKDNYRGRINSSAYFGVVCKTDDCVELVRDTTYLKVKKQLESEIKLD